MAQKKKELFSTILWQTMRFRERHETIWNTQGYGQARGHKQEKIGDGNSFVEEGKNEKIGDGNVSFARAGNFQRKIEKGDRVTVPLRTRKDLTRQRQEQVTFFEDQKNEKIGDGNVSFHRPGNFQRPIGRVDTADRVSARCPCLERMELMKQRQKQAAQETKEFWMGVSLFLGCGLVIFVSFWLAFCAGRGVWF